MALYKEEMYKQGDYEKQHNLEVSMFCDRTRIGWNKKYHLFQKKVCLPLYDSLNQYLQNEKILLILQ